MAKRAPETNQIGNVIHEITALKSNPNLRRIFVGKKCVATLRATDIQELKLTAGSQWNDTTADRVEACVEINRARKAAMSLLGQRAFSKRELQDRLETKDYSHEVAQHIVEELADDHWLNDQTYAESLVREICHKKPASARLLADKLRDKKIAPDLAEVVVQRVLDETDQIDKAVEFCRKRLTAMKELPKSTAARRIAGLLARRGFEDDEICEVIARLGLSSNDASE